MVPSVPLSCHQLFPGEGCAEGGGRLSRSALAATPLRRSVGNARRARCLCRSWPRQNQCQGRQRRAPAPKVNDGTVETILPRRSCGHHRSTLVAGHSDASCDGRQRMLRPGSDSARLHRQRRRSGSVSQFHQKATRSRQDLSFAVSLEEGAKQAHGSRFCSKPVLTPTSRETAKRLRRVGWCWFVGFRNE
jgi:hypothetical protein